LADAKKMPVCTKSGIKLGKISDVEIDPEKHLIFSYKIKNNFLSSKFLLIKPAQIVGIINKKIIVDDAVASDMAIELAGKKDSPTVLSGVSAAQIEE
jgi:sporulation protein YlmC with PRC-barrel domain